MAFDSLITRNLVVDIIGMDVLNYLNVQILILLQIWEEFTIMSSRIFFLLLSHLFGTSMMHVLLCLMVPLRHLRLFIFLIFASQTW